MADDKPIVTKDAAPAATAAPDVATILRKQAADLADAIRAAQTAGYFVDARDLENVVVSATGAV